MIPRELIERHLEEVLAGPAFTAAPTASLLLRHLVSRALEGRDAELKENAIAADVFGRGEAYRRTDDSLVRVQVGKLRRRLAAHYESAPGAELRIEIPKGSYVPRFVAQPREARRGPAWIGSASIRFAAAGALVLVLALGAVLVRGPSPSISVRVDGDPAMAAELAHVLGQFRGVTVAAGQRSSHVLEAVVRGREGGRIRIVATLAERGGSGRQIWSDAVESDGAATQAALARRIAASLRDRAPLAVLAPPAARRSSTAARLAEGRELWSRATAGSLSRSRDMFGRLVQEEPDFAPAWAALADAWNLSGALGAAPPREAFAASRRAAQRALELDPLSAEAHRAMAYVLQYGAWNPEQAAAEYGLALDLAPRDPMSRHWYAECLTALGRFDDAVAAAREAVALDPEPALYRAGLGLALANAGHLVEAERHLRSALDRSPELYAGNLWLGHTYLLGRNYRAALASYRKAAEVAGPKAAVLGGIIRAHAGLGQREEALRWKREFDRLARQPSLIRVAVAAALGDRATADGDLRLLASDPAFQYWINQSPALRAEPFVRPYLVRIGG